MTMEKETETAMASSRLIVKNLPQTINEDKLRKHFALRGEITDVKLKYNAEKKFRGFAFVGFKTPELATEARDYFNKSFIGTSQITVELCVGLADAPKPASKAAREKEKAEKLKKKSIEKEDDTKPAKRKRKEDEILEKCEQDPAFMEFLQAHKKTAATWGNDTLVDELMKMKRKDKTVEENVDDNDIPVGETKKKKKGSSSTLANTGDVDDSQSAKKSKKHVEFFTLKLRDVPQKAKKKDIKSFFAPLKFKSIRFPRGVRGIVYVGFGSETDRLQAFKKNKSILFGKKVNIRIYDKNEGNEVEENPKGHWQKLQEELEKVVEPVGESGRIFLRNLPYTTNEDEVKQIFEEFGPITELHLPIDKMSRRLKGFGFVSFMLPEHAHTALKALDGTPFQGRMLHLLPAKAQDDLETSELNAGSSYKTAKEQKQTKSASLSHNWNALFLGTSAVSKVISEKYGISREEMLLDKNEEKDNGLASVGVRMALAETEIVSETKSFLEDNGVCLDAFDSNDKAERSKTTMLAKNLPAGTSVNDLKDLFLKHGVLNRIVMPPSGITGIVEFAEPAEARAAFKKLAYTKFFNVPLYLEWAPIGVFSRPVDKNEASKLKLITGNVDKTKPKDTNDKQMDPVSKILQQDEEYEPVDENAVPELDTTLFVKNLNFRTNEEPLRKHFVQCGPVYSVTVARKKDPDNADILLSMGYGFVQYYRKKDTEKALGTLNGTMLENHILELKRSSRTLVKANAEIVKKMDNSTKILVRNVPFSATQDEITDLFKTFGKLKAVRLPKKLTGGNEHRGFAFIEYHSESDARKAFDTLSKSTHLYGRRLVLEWAAQDETIDDLRAKTARLASASRGEGNGETIGGSTKKKLQNYFKSQSSSTTNNDDEEEEGE